MGIQATQRKQRHTASRQNGETFALLYPRVSSKEQEKEGMSLPAQLADLRSYASAHGWTIYGVYSEVMRGSREDRPRYQAMLADARRLRAEGKNAVIVVKWLHRLGRKLRESLRCRTEFTDLGIAIHSAAEGGLVSDLVANIYGAVAEEEVRQLGERVSETWDHAFANGWHMTGRLPIGYCLRAATDKERGQGAPKKVLAESPASPTVTQAFLDFAAGKSLWSIARDLAGLPDAIRGKRQFNKMGLRRMLSNPTYIQRQHPHKGHETVEETLAQPIQRWPRLIDDATWATCVERLNASAGTHAVPATYLLSGMLRCPRCGCRMTAFAPKSQAYRRYQCSSRDLGARAPIPGCLFGCTMPVVERAVLLQVGQLLATTHRASAQPALRRALEYVWAQRQRPAQLAADQRHLLAQAVEDHRVTIDSATIKFVAGKLPEAAYNRLMAREQAALGRAEDTLKGFLAQQGSALAMPPATLAEIMAKADRLLNDLASADLDTARGILGAILVSATPIREARGKYTVTLDLTSLGEHLEHLYINCQEAQSTGRLLETITLPLGRGPAQPEQPDWQRLAAAILRAV